MTLLMLTKRYIIIIRERKIKNLFYLKKNTLGISKSIFTSYYCILNNLNR